MQKNPQRADPPARTRALEEGVVLQRAGRHREAERHYIALLAQWPANADVLQLLGVALKAQGKLADAEERLRQSLGARPGQPHVWTNLANLLADDNRAPEAVAAYREALKHDESAVAAWLGLAAVLLRGGDAAAAAQAYERANQLDPHNAAAAIGLASIASRNFDHEKAELLLRQALVREPENAAALHNLGMVLAVQGDGRAACPLIERALALRPGRADMLTGLAFALQVGGETNAAIQRYREAIASNPHHLAAHENLARLLWQTGEHDAYLADLDATIARFPNAPELHLSRANLLGLARRHAEAHEAFARAGALRPDDPAALDGMARMAGELGDTLRCLVNHDSAVRLAPRHAGFLVSRCHSLLRFDKPERAVAALEAALAVEPDHQLALGDLSLALRAANDPRERWLADYERFVACIDVRPPRGYEDMNAFNTDLDRALDELHHVQSEPIDQTLRHGTQTLGSLFGRKIDLVSRLRERIDEAVASYIRALPDDPAHPFLRRKSAAFRHRGSWSSRLKRSGYHVTHVHPDGWISSAYYVALPLAVDDPAKKEGSLTFGDPPFDLQWTEPVRRFVRPREGMLVLFPSYFYHGTVPFGGQQARTTIAFDAIPAS